MKLGVIIASTRSRRIADLVGPWVLSQLAEREDFDVDLIDLRDLELPAAIYDGHPKLGNYPDSVKPFAERIDAAEGFLVITPEYNHGYPASLKQAFDLIYKEWMAKPIGFVSYGGASGGVRATEQLRQVVGELHMADVRDGVTIPFARNHFDADGQLLNGEAIEGQLKATLDDLLWWGHALNEARAARPYPG